ncbi:hypothetical protein CL653_02115 [bacterium]|nr:hypothetical protein [bacterium]|tara:strand:+ start:1142 stop:1456 length:315 start_codon:yes stop_codon:yes gene_type:complete
MKAIVANEGEDPPLSYKDLADIVANVAELAEQHPGMGEESTRSGLAWMRDLYKTFDTPAMVGQFALEQAGVEMGDLIPYFVFQSRIKDARDQLSEGRSHVNALP